MMIAEVADALILLDRRARGGRRTPEFKTGAERAVWTALGEGAALSMICARAGLPAREGLVALSAMEMTGAIECLLTGEIRRRL